MPLSDGQLSTRESAVLGHVTPRRFELLLRAAKLTQPFTASDLKRSAPDVPGRTVSLDLGALEAAGLITADPSADQPRQGRPVVYTIAPDVPDVFARLASVVSVAWRSTPPASST
jgi:DNA-binding transcriptional ArsR family regulator